MVSMLGKLIEAGGWTAYAALALVALSCIGAIAASVVAGRGGKTSVPAMMLLPCMALAVGLFHEASEIWDALGRYGSVSPSSWGRLVLRTSWESRATGILAMAGTSLASLMAAFGVALGMALFEETRPRWTRGTGVTSALIALAGSFGLAAWCIATQRGSLVFSVLFLLAGSAVALSGSRVGTNKEDLARTMGARGFVWFFATCSLVTGFLAVLWASRFEASLFFRYALPTMRLELIQTAWADEVILTRQGGLAAALGVVAFGVPSLVLARYGLSKRNLANAALFFALFFLMCCLFTGGWLQHRRLLDTLDGEERLSRVLQGHVRALPVPRGPGGVSLPTSEHPHGSCAVLSSTEGWRPVEGFSCENSQDAPLVLVEALTPLRVLAENQWYARQGELQVPLFENIEGLRGSPWMVERNGVGVASLLWVREGERVSGGSVLGLVLEEEGVFFLLQGTKRVRLGKKGKDITRGLNKHLSSISLQQGDLRGGALVWLWGPTMTVQDVVSQCLAARRAAGGAIRSCALTQGGAASWRAQQKP